MKGEMEHYAGLEQALHDYTAGKLPVDRFKPLTAAHGIYQQRDDDAFMVRLRLTGGRLLLAEMVELATLIERSYGRAYLTTRQDIQIHDLDVDDVMPLIRACSAMGRPFKGGGGNTYRNLLVESHSGLVADSSFDVEPYALAVHRAVMAEPRAFELPRKIKAGFYATERELRRASVQDLGFVAQVRDGKRGFRVYSGGGMGATTLAGMVLCDFLPAEYAVALVLRGVAILHEHGDRQNKSKARLRFVRQRLGDEAFRELFRIGQWSPADAAAGLSDGELAAVVAIPEAVKLAGMESGTMGDLEIDEALYQRWLALATEPNAADPEVCSVRVFVKHGRLSPAEMRQLVSIIAATGCYEVRLLPTRQLLVPFVKRRNLPWLYQRLRDDVPQLDATLTSFKGHLVSCVGAKVCRIGMADAPAIAESVAGALDELLAEGVTGAEIKALLAEVRVSGCPNACAATPIGALGVGSQLRRIEGELCEVARPWLGAAVAGSEIRISEPHGEFVAVAELPELMLELARNWLQARRSQPESAG